MRPKSRVRRFILMGVLIAAVSAPAAVSASTRPEGLVPDPARQPVFHRSQSSGVDLGHLRIPAIGVDEVVRSGVSLSVIDRGVAHWAGTAGPGGDGNVVLAGHRSTHSQPFHDLDRLEHGDLIYLRGGDGLEVMYRVEDSFVVDPSAIWITYNREDPSLTLFACHPKGSARFRIVVTAELVAGGRIA